MFKHEKQLLKEVRVDAPNPNYANMLQEQLGGPQGELKAALQYFTQSFRIKDPRIKDLFLDIAAEELGHLEMVATLVILTNSHEIGVILIIHEIGVILIGLTFNCLYNIIYAKERV